VSPDTRTFCRYVFPAMGSSMITALYFVVDGIFIGQGINEIALAAVNLALPVIILIIAITMMMTMGGATLTSISLGEKDPASANRSFGMTCLLVMIFSVIAALICALFPEAIALISGASEITLADTATYIRWYCIFLIFYCMAMCLSVFVRNDDDPNLAMWAMTAGALANIFLDWLFIFPLQWGLVGAAVASGLGQALSCGLLLIHFVRKKGQLRLNLPLREKAAWRLSGQICRRGLPEFFTQMSQTVTIFCYNILTMRYLHEMGVAAFGIMCYLAEIFIAIFIGVSEGIQPLISYNYGAGNKEKQRFFFRGGLLVNVGLAILIYVLMLAFGPAVISIFNDNPQLIALTYDCVKVYAISFIPAAINIVFTIRFLAIKRTGVSLLISGTRSFVLNTALIFLIPALLDGGMLYTGIIAAEVLVAAGCIIYGIAKRHTDPL